MVNQHHDHRGAERAGVRPSPNNVQPVACFDGDPPGDPTGARCDLEWVSLGDPVLGYLVTNGGGQKREHLLCARLNPESHEGITVRFIGGADGTTTQGEDTTV